MRNVPDKQEQSPFFFEDSGAFAQFILSLSKDLG